MKKVVTFLLLITTISILSCDNTPTSKFSYKEENDGTVMFYDSSENAKTYQWDFGDGTFEQSQNPKHTFEKNGKYNVKLTTSNGKQDISSISTVVVNSVKQASYAFSTPSNELIPLDVFVDDIFVGQISKAVFNDIDKGNLVIYSTSPGEHTVSVRHSNIEVVRDMKLIWEAGKTKNQIFTATTTSYPSKISKKKILEEAKEEEKKLEITF